MNLVALVKLGTARPSRDDLKRMLSGSWPTRRQSCRPRPIGEVLDSALTPQFPPADEVARLWRECQPVTSSREAVLWPHGGADGLLAQRCISWPIIEMLDAARVVPPGRAVPGWARCGSVSWGAAGYSLVVPLFDAEGCLRSLHVRCLRASSGQRKALFPSGFASGGLVMADATARRLLAADPAAVEFVRANGLIIVEGLPDFLSAVSEFSDADDAAPAVIGLPGSGSWTDAIAARIPDGCRVTLATHHDAPGEAYAAAVARSLRGRTIDVSRWFPRGVAP